MSLLQIPSPIHELKSDFLDKKGVELWLKRDDLIHPEISGNKWRKLKYNFEEAQKQDLNRIITFGGAYSNHIAATAATGKWKNIRTIGVIRGEEGFENETLREAEVNGMQLHFVSRTDYKLKTEISFLNALEERFGKSYIVPEGGANELGVKGCKEIMQEINQRFDYVVCSAGTGTTVSGICNCLKEEKLMVFPALKGAGFILEEMKKYCSAEQLEKVDLQLDYHFGGYAKRKPELLDFYHHFLKEYQIELDLIYTAKMMFGLFDLIKKNHFKRGTKMVAIHTGGVQGNGEILK